jgi:hypothetical protein
VDEILKGRELDNDDGVQGVESRVNVSGGVSGKINCPLSDRNARSMFAPSLEVDPGKCAIAVSSSGWPIQFMSISPESRKSILLQSKVLWKCFGCGRRCGCVEKLEGRLRSERVSMKAPSSVSFSTVTEVYESHRDNNCSEGDYIPQPGSGDSWLLTP